MQDTTIGRLYFLPVLIYSSRSLLHGCYVECVSFLYFVCVTVKTILIKIKIFLGVLPVSSKRIIRLLFFRKQDTILNNRYFPYRKLFLALYYPQKNPLTLN